MQEEKILDEIELRVVASLLEKKMSTPEYYPMTLNALKNACNQSSNRDPVVAFDEKTVASALERLRDKGFSRVVHAADSRVPKYKETLTEYFMLGDEEAAVLCELMLRGAQTVGELRNRTARLWNFKELSEVEEALTNLIEKPPRPLIVRLPRQPGQKEPRSAHLLAGEVNIEEIAASHSTHHAPRIEAAMLEARAENERFAKLETEVETLKQELENLKQQFEGFKKQFE
jgi:uncharacterized protein